MLARAVQFSEHPLIPKDSVEVEGVFIEGSGDIGHAISAQNIQRKGTCSRENSGVTSDAACIFAQSDVPDVMKPIFQPPMVTDDVGKRPSASVVVGDLEGGILPFLPSACLGLEGLGPTLDFNHRLEMSAPALRQSVLSRLKDRDLAVLDPTAGLMLVGYKRRIAGVGLRCDVLHGVVQLRLIAFDLDHDVIAGAFGDLEGFFDSVEHRA